MQSLDKSLTEIELEFRIYIHNAKSKNGDKN